MASWDQAALDRHNAAFNQAKAEAVCSCGSVVMLTGQHAKGCPCDLSRLAQRAEEIRREMEKEHAK